VVAVSLEDRRQLAHCIPLIYSRKPRLTTARELLLTTQRLSSSLKTFDAPFLVLHGLDDKITDPKLSQALYDESSSPDKTIKLYEGMYHTITSGEPAENLDIVFADIINWIEARL
jgi:caffeoylshikimate esterase